MERFTGHNYEHDLFRDVYCKLQYLEDIEELCEKIVSQPIYEKYEDNGKIHKEDYTEYKALYNFKERRIELYGYEFINWFELDKYGKTWALDKEEFYETLSK